MNKFGKPVSPEYEAERQRNQDKLFSVGVRTHVPSKWRLVDLETGDIWRWHEPDRLVHATDLFAEPRDVLSYIPLTLHELADLIAELAGDVQAEDSFEGRINWLLPDPKSPDPVERAAAERHEFMVNALWRIGNSQGQGGVRMLQREDADGSG